MQDASVLIVGLGLLTRRRLLLISAAAFASGFIPALPTPAAEGQRRIVAVLDIDRPGARAAYARFVRAVEGRGLPARFGVDPKFIPVDQIEAGDLASLPARLKTLAPAVVITTSLPTTMAVRNLNMPVIFFIPAGDPVALGFAESLRRPGRNMTGYASRLASPEKMLEVLADALPGARRIALLIDEIFAKYVLDREALFAVARNLGLHVELPSVETIEDFETFAAKRLRSFDALAVPYTGVPFRHGERMLADLNRRRMPALFGSGRLARAGALMGLEADIGDSAETFARQLEAICLGVAPGDIPIERPKTFRLTLNLDTARRIGVRFPPQFVIRADTVLT